MTNPTIDALPILERARDRILRQGAMGAKITVDYRSDRENNRVVVGDAWFWFDEERVVATITPEGLLTVKQNWSEPGQPETAKITVEPCDETREPYLKATERIRGTVPHPPVEWHYMTGPQVRMEMGGEVIMEAGPPQSWIGANLNIRLTGGRTVKTFAEAERILDELYPQYPPISIEYAKARLP